MPPSSFGADLEAGRTPRRLPPSFAPPPGSPEPRPFGYAAWTWTAAVMAGLLSAGATYMVVSQRLAERHRTERAVAHSDWEVQRATLEAEIERLREVPGGVVSIPTDAGSGGTTDPAGVLRRLSGLRSEHAGWNPATLRRAIHDLGQLAETGPRAIPAIREHLRDEPDIRFPTPGYEPWEGDGAGASNSDGAGGEGSDGRLPRWEFVLPPSLRIGLFDVLRTIGGEAAERILAEALRTATDGREVAYLAHFLEDIAPDKYRQLALTAARDLLANPPVPDTSGSGNDGARRYLESVRERFGEPGAEIVFPVREALPPTEPFLPTEP